MEPENISNIQRFFRGSTVFITGATGFLGKLLLEKLLRTCKGIDVIYILIREKKGKSVNQRYEEVFDSPIFAEVKKENPKFLKKVIFIKGDCALPNLDLSEQDQRTLLREVNCVFHCAATVRFNEKLGVATYINVRATRDILILSKNMNNLKSFVYISTAYSFCINREIKERFYEPTLTGDKLLLLVDTLKDDTLDRITPTLLGKWPNAYSFTKSIAEQVVKSYGNDLPIAIVRPSMVQSTIKEPIPGWIDNVYGPTGVSVGTGLGIVRVICNDLDKIADVVPADYVTNCVIAASWNAGIKERQADICDSDIYNFSSYTQNPITWGEFKRLAGKHARNIPTPLSVWYPFLICTSSYILYRILNMFLHIIPACIVDSIAFCIGKQPILLRGYRKIHTFLDLIVYFITEDWNIHNENTQGLWRKLGEEDKRLFHFDIRGFKWDDYCCTYARGVRLFLLKDPLDTLPQGRRKYWILAIIHHVLIAVLLFGLFKLAMLFW